MADASLAERTLACQAGMPMATRMPMIEMTIISSTSENPRLLLFLLLLIAFKDLTDLSTRARAGRVPQSGNQGGTSAPGVRPAAAPEFYYTEPSKSQRRQKGRLEARG